MGIFCIDHQIVWTHHHLAGAIHSTVNNTMRARRARLCQTLWARERFSSSLRSTSESLISTAARGMIELQSVNPILYYKYFTNGTLATCPSCFAVGNRDIGRFMYQMICPVLERLQASVASDGAGTGTEIDFRSRGGLRAHDFRHRGGQPGGNRPEVLGVSSAPSGAGATAPRGGGSRRSADRRLGRLSARRAPVDQVARVLELFDTRYWDFTASTCPREAGGRSRLQAQLQLAAAELASPWAQARGAQAWAHRRKRPRRELPGMMLHQDGSSHEWVKVDGGT